VYPEDEPESEIDQPRGEQRGPGAAARPAAPGAPGAGVVGAWLLEGVVDLGVGVGVVVGVVVVGGDVVGGRGAGRRLRLGRGP
jgi:hypothetical protein